MLSRQDTAVPKLDFDIVSQRLAVIEQSETFAHAYGVLTASLESRGAEPIERLEFLRSIGAELKAIIDDAERARQERFQRADAWLWGQVPPWREGEIKFALAARLESAKDSPAFDQALSQHNASQASNGVATLTPSEYTELLRAVFGHWEILSRLNCGWMQ